MKLKLSPGNIIYLSGGFYRRVIEVYDGINGVKAKSLDGHYRGAVYPAVKIKPAKITRGLSLDELGFKHVKDNIYKRGNIILYNKSDCYILEINGQKLKEVEHVHQLQNLVFELLDVEL